MKAYIKGKEVKRGDTIKDFRGEEWTYIGIEQKPSPGKSGKVKVERNGVQQVYYPGVFHIQLTEVA